MLIVKTDATMPPRSPAQPAAAAAAAKMTTALLMTPAIAGAAAFTYGWLRWRQSGPTEAAGLFVGLAAFLIGGLISMYLALLCTRSGSRRRWLTTTVAAVAIVVPLAIALYPIVTVLNNDKHGR